MTKAVTTRTPIESCELCASLPEFVETNYKIGDERLPRLKELEDVCRWEGENESGEVRIGTRVFRCARCRTLYLEESIEDYDKGFLEAWSDVATTRRLTTVEALDALAKREWLHGNDAPAAREELRSTRDAIAGELRTLIVEGRSPNADLLCHAVAAVLDHALDSGDRDVVRGVLLRATDPMARLECVARLRDLGFEEYRPVGTAALRASAREFFAEEDTGALLASTLVSVLHDPRKDYAAGDRKKHTHELAPLVLGRLVATRKPIAPEVFGVVLGLLLDEDAAIAAAGASAAFAARWNIAMLDLPAELADAFAAWLQKHPENVHGRKLQPDFTKTK